MVEQGLNFHPFRFRVGVVSGRSVYRINNLTCNYSKLRERDGISSDLSIYSE